MKNKNNTMRLTEDRLRAIIAESVRSALNEISYSTVKSAHDKMKGKGQIVRASRLSDKFGEIYNDDDVQYNVADNTLTLRQDENPYNYANRMHRYENGDTENARQGLYTWDAPEQINQSQVVNNHHITSNPKLARKYAKAVKNYNPNTNLTKDDYRL